MYNTKQEMIDRFNEQELIQLTDDADAGVIDDTTLNQAITDAAAVIDGYLAGRYQLPLTTIPNAIKVYSCDMARFNLYVDGATEHVEKRNKDAIKFLELVANGKVNLGLADDGSAATPSGGAQMESGGRVFKRNQGGFL